MADLNALIAQGYQFQPAPDPFANYAKMQQLDVGEQTNQLNRMKMQVYQRGMDEQNQLRQLYATPGIDQNSQEFSRRMAAISPTAYQAHVKSVQEGKKSAADIGLAEARTLEAGAGTAQKKQQLAKDQRDFVRDSLSSLSFNPSDANITAFAEDAVLMKHLTPEQAQAKKDQLLAMPIDQRRIYLAQQGMSTADTAKLFESKPVEKTDGQTKWMEETNPRLPTFGQRMTGAPTVQMKMTPGETSTAVTAANRLAWEKANPGYQFEQDQNGNMFGINKKTLEAIPITIGGAAPAAAAPMGGGQGARGVVGVTDGGRTMVPFVGKSAGGVTEGERKAATLMQRLQFSQSQLTQALVDDPNAAKPGVLTSALAKLSTPLANTLTPEARQRVESAQLDMLDAALTLGTGAAYTKEQLEGYRNSYFPSVGDGPTQVKDKKARLENVIAAAKIAAGKAAKLVPPAPTVNPAAVSDDRAAADKILGVQ